MNIFGKTVMDTCSILNECGDIEDSYVDSIFSQDLLNDFVDTFACLDEIEEDYCVYAPQAAVVFENNGTYYIELEQVAKVADYNEVSLEEAIDMIADSQLHITFEQLKRRKGSISDDLISMIIAEAKTAKGSKLEEAKTKGMKKTTDAVNKLKEKVKVVKKPAKKGSKVGKKDKKNKKKDEDDDI